MPIVILTKNIWKQPFLFFRAYNRNYTHVLSQCQHMRGLLLLLLLLFRPDLLLENTDKTVPYIIELTVGFESNLESNAHRKKTKYKHLINEQKQSYNDMKFINLSISALGVFGKECKSYLEMLDSLGFDDHHKRYFIRKIMTLSIRSTYYVFCGRNKEWTNPQLLNY